MLNLVASVSQALEVSLLLLGEFNLANPDEAILCLLERNALKVAGIVGFPAGLRDVLEDERPMLLA